MNDTKYELGQKITIRNGFYAPLNAIISRVNTRLLGSTYATLDGFISSSKENIEYEASYEQHGSEYMIKTKVVSESDVQVGWHGMTCNGDYEEFKKFGVDVPGFDKKENLR